MIWSAWSLLKEATGVLMESAPAHIDVDEVQRRAPENWYLDAEEAHALGLVHEVI